MTGGSEAAIGTRFATRRRKFVDSICCSDEARLSGVAGSSGFAESFTAAGHATSRADPSATST